MPATLPVSYTSVALMIEMRPEVNSIATVTSATLHGLAGQAEALVNAHVGKRYTLPLTTDYPLLTTLATELAVYRVLSRRTYVTKDQREASGIQAIYDEATSVLSGLAAGIVPLIDTSGTVLAAATDTAPVYYTTKPHLPTFHEGPTGTHILDEDKVDDLLDERDFGTLKSHLV